MISFDDENKLKKVHVEVKKHIENKKEEDYEF